MKTSNYNFIKDLKNKNLIIIIFIFLLIKIILTTKNNYSYFYVINTIFWVRNSYLCYI